MNPENETLINKTIDLEFIDGLEMPRINYNFSYGPDAVTAIAMHLVASDEFYVTPDGNKGVYKDVSSLLADIDLHLKGLDKTCEDCSEDKKKKAEILASRLALLAMRLCIKLGIEPCAELQNEMKHCKFDDRYKLIYEMKQEARRILHPASIDHDKKYPPPKSIIDFAQSKDKSD